MALGKTHERFNLFFIASFVIFALFSSIRLPFILSFLVGSLFSTYVFSPDTDISPKKRLGPIAIFFYPYSLLCKHRGLAHHPIWGTLGRVIYLLLIFLLLTYVGIFKGPNLLDFDSTMNWFLSFGKNDVLGASAFLIGIWFFIGLFIGDLLHLILDKLTDSFKKLKKIF